MRRTFAKKVKPFNCGFCNKGFLLESSLRNHEQSHLHNPAPEPPVVNQAPTMMSTPVNQHNHPNPEREANSDQMSQQVPHQVPAQSTVSLDPKATKAFACGICGKLFSQQRQMLNHEQTHAHVQTDGTKLMRNSDKLFQCGVCMRVFAHQSTLRNHSRIHTGEKPYQCRYCIRAFAHQSTLRNHERIHTGERPYTCDICHRCFSHQTTLNNHKRTHKNESISLCQL
uniref:C2H2-type domain-containing protein n=2 Tax=Octopus bimaculoides TaxID=37653 RepID=A0A0L8I580_OCTBM